MQVRMNLKSEADHTVSDRDRLRVECGALSAIEAHEVVHLNSQGT
jgi:hypothetical protein